MNDLSSRARALYSGRKVTVMGLGLFKGGSTVTRFLAQAGAQVTVTDLRSEQQLAPALEQLRDVNVRCVLGEHRREDFTASDLVIANPAVAPSNQYLQAAREAKVAISSEVALFLELCPARIAAITGTQGKSSTSNMLHQLLTLSGQPSLLGGNIGRSLLEELDGMDETRCVVLELSSYQLEALPTQLAGPPRVEVACVVNVLADHLERHGTIDNYAAAKQRIFELVAATGGYGVLSAECPRLSQWRSPQWRRIDVHETKPARTGLNIRDGRFRLEEEVLGRVADLRVPGAFQAINALQALGMARLMGAQPERLAEAVGRLRGLPHRMEELGEFHGVRVIDNGVSTTPDSTISALQTLEPGCTLLLGGAPKQNLPLDELVAIARERARRVVIFGAATKTFPAAFQGSGLPVEAVTGLQEAVGTAFAGLRPGETLLFSPACASFDAYLNFEERARDFRSALPR